MFAKSHRFSFKKGIPKRIYQTPMLVIRYDKNEQSRFECAVVVGKKVDKRAVVRNKIKRQLVSIIKEILGDEPYTIIVYAKKHIYDTSFETKRDELIQSFKAIKILP